MLVCETDKAVDLPEEISNFGIWKQKPMVSVSDRIRALALIGKS